MTPLQTNLLPGIDHTMAVHTHLRWRLGSSISSGRGRLCAKETAAKAHTTWNQKKRNITWGWTHHSVWDISSFPKESSIVFTNTWSDNKESVWPAVFTLLCIGMVCCIQIIFYNAQQQPIQQDKCWHNSEKCSIFFQTQIPFSKVS